MSNLFPLAVSHPLLTKVFCVILIVLCPILEMVRNKIEHKKLEEEG